MANGGEGGPKKQAEVVSVSMRVQDSDFSIEDFLRYPLKPLSTRATRGFLKRARQGNLRFSSGFIESLDQHLGSAEAGESQAA